MRNTMTRVARVVRTRSVQLRLVLVLVAIALLLIGNIPTAYAGELGRTCKTFHSGGNPNSPWKFELCVKLVHDPVTHTWWSTGKIVSSTSGIKLYLDNVSVTVNGYRADLYSQSSEPSATFVTGESWTFRCSGTASLSAFVTGHARWPNGVTSGIGYVPTGVYAGTC